MPRPAALSLFASLSAWMAPAIAQAAPATEPVAPPTSEPEAAPPGEPAPAESPDETKAPPGWTPADASAGEGAATPTTTEGGATLDAGANVDAGAPPTATTSGETTTTTRTGREPLSKRKHLKWIKRWAPEPRTFEGGIYLGVLFPSRNLELFEADIELPDQGFRRYDRAAFDIGGRVGFYPIRHFGFELEGGAMPTQAEDTRTTLWTVRGQFVGQVGLWSVVPFALVGVGGLGVASDRIAVGNDVDPALHFGLGVKAYLSRYTMLRLDLRDNITSKRGVGRGATNSFEILLGFSVVLGRKKDVDAKARPPEPTKDPDRDGDGVLDFYDKCPDEPGPKPSGCPAPGDRDADGFMDPDDKCPDEPGIAPDGCPDKDADQDGILVPDDKCPTEPETKNGFEDGDGCPDGIPTEVEQFEGTLEGVFFDFGADTLREESKATLDKAAEILSKHPSVKVEISGHTDAIGGREANMNLSQRRADAVKRYLVDKGIKPEQIETRGAGPDEPIDSNKSNAGRAKNRRIEFRVLR